MSKNWNFWVEIVSGSMEWVDFDNNQISKIVFSKLMPEYSLPNTLILPIDLSLSTAVHTLQDFPANGMPDIPDFSMTVNCGYTSPDGSFTTLDVIQALEQHNAAQGKLFSLSGRVFRAVCGNIQNVGAWYDSGWTSAFGPVAFTAPIPSSNETGYIFHEGMIDRIERISIENLTIHTSVPSYLAEVGDPIESVNGDGIPPVIFSRGGNYAECKIERLGNYAGIIRMHNLPINFESTFDLYVKANSSDNYLKVDPSSYTVDHINGYIKLIAVNKFADLTLNRSEEYDEIFDGRSVGAFVTPFIDYVDLTESVPPFRYLGENDEVFTFDRAGAFCPEDRNPKQYVNEHYPKVNGAFINQTNASGRGVDGTDRATIGGGIFPSSGNSESKFSLFTKINESSSGCYPSTHSLDSIIEELNDGIALESNKYVKAYGGNGDIKAFIDRSKGLSVPSSWLFTGRYAPVTVYARKGNSPSIGSLDIYFSGLENIDGEYSYTSGAKLILSGSYSYFLGPNSNSSFSDVARLNIYDAEDKLIHYESVYNSESVNVRRKGYWNDTEIRLNPATLKAPIKNLSKLRIALTFPFTDVPIDDPRLADDGYGNLSISSAKIEVSGAINATTGTKLYLLGTTFDATTAGEAVEKLYSEWSDREEFTSVYDGENIEASINQAKELRSFSKDILFSGGVGFRNSLFHAPNSNEAVYYDLYNFWGEVAGGTMYEITDSEVFTDTLLNAEVNSVSVSEIYNVYQVVFDYDPATNQWQKGITVDSSGWSFSGFTLSAPDTSSPQKCAYATTIIGDKRKIKRVELPYATINGAVKFIQGVCNILSYPRKYGSVSLPFTSLPNINHMRRVFFTGSKFPPFMTDYGSWLILSFQIDAEQNAIDITQMLQVPNWSFLNG